MIETTLPPSLEASLDGLTAQLIKSLGNNLYSCILYGSAIRGDFAARSSDINLLIILNESTTDAHEIIAEALAVHSNVRVDPLVLGRAGIKRNFEMAGAKFVSISRDFRILHGSDPFRGLQVDTNILKFLTEQSLRSLRMRAVRAYVLYSKERTQYVRFVNRMRTSIFSALSDIIRLTDSASDLPHDFSDRPKVIGEFLGTDASVLEDFLQVGGREKLSPQEIRSLHLGLYNLLSHAIFWMESHWQNGSI